MTLTLLAALTSLAQLSGLAWAQDTPEPAEEVPVAVDPALEAELASLRASLAQAEAALAQGAGSTEALQQTLDQLAVLLDGRREGAERVAAAEALGALADPQLIPFFYNAVHAGPPAVKRAAIEALRSTPTAEVTPIASWALQRGTEDLSRAAMQLLADIPEDAAADVLYAYAMAPDTEEPLREAAVEALQLGHADYLAERGMPQPPLRKAGGEALIGVAANGVAGGILLSSIGVWGRSDIGVVIGAVGGALVGAGTGATYALTRPVTLSHSLQYAGGVGWGLELGVLTTQAIYGDEWGGSRDSVGALLRATGVAAGATGAYLRFKKDVDPVDVTELNLSMLLGQQLGFGAAHLALDRGYGYEGAWDLDTQPRMLSALGGTAAGAAVGLALRDRWELDEDDLTFAAVTGAELLWVGAWLPMAIDERGHMGAPRFAWAAGTSAALAFSEFADPSLARTGSMAYGFTAGTAFGAGLPMLAQREGVQPAAASMLALGALGGGLGYAVGERLDMDPGSYATLMVGIPLTIAQASGYSFVLYERDVLNDTQPVGFILTASGAGAAGLLGLTQFIQPSSGQAIVTGSGAAWGAWYGVLVPVAAGAELDPDQLMLSTLLVSDLGLAGAAILQSPAVGLQPRSTLLPQLGGVSGATLGALGAALVTGDGEVIAGGAVLGSLLGFGGGALLEVNQAKKRQTRTSLSLPRPDVDLPGQWSVMASPTVMENGEMGGQVMVTGVGF
ncbi:MAG: HEAT repeat domain-containing protein [Alphaproteobacteria bacterium]|nr:HEAT repeat domain-containing protein [Alphaproteobacteria bacterium]MCB9794934.1 HEAT repeat domain-containing protein [Alphaproteobacteria bacterium]